MKKYYPILLSKKGELVALQHLTQLVKDDISPVIEVLRDSIEKKVKEDGIEKTVYKDEFENFLKTHWVFFNNQIILDFSLVESIDEKINEIKKLLISLLKAGVNVIPAIQKNSSLAFVKIIKDLLAEYRLNCCFRTSEASGGFDDFKDDIENLVKQIGINENRIILLMDLGYAKHDNTNYLTSSTKFHINSLTKKIPDWLSIIVASSSFPENLTDIKPPHKAHRLPRYEWVVWNNIKKDQKFSELKYGDFGTKHPFFQDAKFAGTVSIKYTVEKEFVIYRGELTDQHDDGHGQYITHASKLIKTEDYLGKNYSWGDKRIYEIANEDIQDDKRKTGSSTTWVQISQNHHITLLNNLL